MNAKSGLFLDFKRPSKSESLTTKGSRLAYKTVSGTGVYLLNSTFCLVKFRSRDTILLFV